MPPVLQTLSSSPEPRTLNPEPSLPLDPSDTSISTISLGVNSTSMPPTPSHVSLDILRTLHRLHRQLTDLRDRNEQGPKRVRGAEANVAHREAELAKAQADLKKLRVAADQKQLQLKAGEEKIKDLQRKLNAATSNREYQTLKDQIAADDMANSVLADEILEALEKSTRRRRRSARWKPRWQSPARRPKRSAARCRSRRPRCRATSPAWRPNCSRPSRRCRRRSATLYQRVVRSRGEDALAAVENEFCGGCNQHVPLNVCAEISWDTRCSAAVAGGCCTCRRARRRNPSRRRSNRRVCHGRLGYEPSLSPSCSRPRGTGWPWHPTVPRDEPERRPWHTRPLRRDLTFFRRVPIMVACFPQMNLPLRSRPSAGC